MRSPPELFSAGSSPALVSVTLDGSAPTSYTTDFGTDANIDGRHRRPDSSRLDCRHHLHGDHERRPVLRASPCPTPQRSSSTPRCPTPTRRASTAGLRHRDGDFDRARAAGHQGRLGRPADPGGPDDELHGHHHQHRRRDRVRRARHRHRTFPAVRLRGRLNVGVLAKRLIDGRSFRDSRQPVGVGLRRQR